MRFKRSTPIREILNYRLAACRRDRRTRGVAGVKCLRWAFTTGQSGGGMHYGIQWFWDGTRWRGMTAHRIVFIVFERNGQPLPKGHEVHHTCGVPMCVELKHLRCVSKSENLRAKTNTPKSRRGPWIKRHPKDVERYEDRIRRGLPAPRGHAYQGQIPMQGA